ncbi:hypothetical protein NADE_009176 [Nannochloris sp. 'desiccata']|nr:hypothetical protein NADE_009176 [Chlorella desiccata (nom. nud.)]
MLEKSRINFLKYQAEQARIVLRNPNVENYITQAIRRQLNTIIKNGDRAEREAAKSNATNAAALRRSARLAGNGGNNK